MFNFDDFEDGEFMGEDTFEDHFEEQMDDPDDMDGGNPADEHESAGFDAGDAFLAGSLLGNVYDEIMDDQKRRELLRKRRSRRDSDFS